MANRQFTQFRNSLEKKLVDLIVNIKFGATGAPTLQVKNSKGVKSVTRTSAGLFVITLQDGYVDLMFARAMFLLAAGVPASPYMFVVSHTKNVITVQFNAGSGASGALVATDPANGEEVNILLIMSDSTAI